MCSQLNFKQNGSVPGRWFAVRPNSVLLGILCLSLIGKGRALADKVVIKAGTSVAVEVMENLNSKLNSTGETVHLRVVEDVKVGNVVVIPKGSSATGKIGETKASQSVGRGGEIEFYVLQVSAIDGQPVSIDKDTLGSEGRQRTGATVGYTLLFGIPGLLAKGRQGVVLRGTQYDVTVKHDTEVDTSAPVAQPALKPANVELSGKFPDKQVVKFAKGKVKEELVAKITVKPEIQGEVQTASSSLEVVKMGDYILPKPIQPEKVELEAAKNTLKVTFDWWEIIRFSAPETTPITVQLKLASGKVAQATLQLESEWKLK